MLAHFHWESSNTTQQNLVTQMCPKMSPCLTAYFPLSGTIIYNHNIILLKKSSKLVVEDIKLMGCWIQIWKSKLQLENFILKFVHNLIYYATCSWHHPSLPLTNKWYLHTRTPHPRSLYYSHQIPLDWHVHNTGKRITLYLLRLRVCSHSQAHLEACVCNRDRQQTK